MLNVFCHHPPYTFYTTRICWCPTLGPTEDMSQSIVHNQDFIHVLLLIKTPLKPCKHPHQNHSYLYLESGCPTSWSSKQINQLEVRVGTSWNSEPWCSGLLTNSLFSSCFFKNWNISLKCESCRNSSWDEDQGLNLSPPAESTTLKVVVVGKLFWVMPFSFFFFSARAPFIVPALHKSVPWVWNIRTDAGFPTEAGELWPIARGETVEKMGW